MCALFPVADGLSCPKIRWYLRIICEVYGYRTGRNKLLGRQLRDRKTENVTGFPFMHKNRPAVPSVVMGHFVGSDGSFLFAAYTRKNVFFAHSTSLQR